MAENDRQDLEEMQNLCGTFYNALNNQDTKALLEIMSDSCRAGLTPEALRKLCEGGIKYEFIDLESARFQKSPLGLCAVAKVKRTVQVSIGRIQEGWREFKFIKESGHWKVFRTEEIMERLVSHFIESGFTVELKQNIETLREGDPFGSWDANDTNVVAAAFKLTQGEAPIFPWEIKFVTAGTKVDRRSLGIDFSLRNLSSRIWDSPFLEFHLKDKGKVVSRGTALLRNVPSGQEIESEISF